MKYLEYRYWELDIKKNYSEEEIISKFNELFRNELAREGSTDCGFNPYKGIGYMTISYNESDGNFVIKDQYGYITCFFLGLYAVRSGGRKLALNQKARGFFANYFKFVEKEDDTYVFVTSIINGKCKLNENVRRMINILYLRQQPICENFNRKKVIFPDYTDEERIEIIKECRKY